jgi:hypothetical protein
VAPTLEDAYLVLINSGRLGGLPDGAAAISANGADGAAGVAMK